MGQRYDRIAVIGAGPSGLAAVKALAQEHMFTHIRCFERRTCVGGLWAYDAEPDQFSASTKEIEQPLENIPNLALFNATHTKAYPERSWMRNASYDTLDTNAGARTMAFTHTAIPFANSTSSVRKFGKNNTTRPRHTVLKYLEELWKPYLHHLSLNTHLEQMKKRADGKWVLTLRKPYVDQGSDMWWQEVYDAVIVASGHFTVPKIPNIDGLGEVSKAHPETFEHSKSWRSTDRYVNKKVIVVGGGVSAADIVEELHDVVQDSLILSQRNELEFLRPAWELPGVVKKPEITQFYLDSDQQIHARFADGSTIGGFDKVIFATGYRLSYSFLPFQAVTPQNRLSGFYQHVFRIGDPSLSVIGQVRAAISFRVYEYQAVAVARYYAGRTSVLPDVSAQEEWENARLAYKGPTELFHEIKPDFVEYYGWLQQFAGDAADGTEGYALPVFQDEWVDSDIGVLLAKNEYWKRLAKQKTIQTDSTYSVAVTESHTQ